jgi:hypothetical protein
MTRHERMERAKCPMSPTGAHWWLMDSSGPVETGVCKYCGKTMQQRNSAAEEYTQQQRRRGAQMRTYRDERKTEVAQ